MCDQKSNPQYALVRGSGREFPRDENSVWVGYILKGVPSFSVDEIREIMRVMRDCAVSNGEVNGISRWTSAIESASDTLQKLVKDGFVKKA